MISDIEKMRWISHLTTFQYKNIKKNGNPGKLFSNHDLASCGKVIQLKNLLFVAEALLGFLFHVVIAYAHPKHLFSWKIEINQNAIFISTEKLISTWGKQEKNIILLV